jgi:hypothetical protein
MTSATNEKPQKTLESPWAWAMPPEPTPREQVITILAEGLWEMILADNGPKKRQWTRGKR